MSMDFGFETFRSRPLSLTTGMPTQLVMEKDREAVARGERMDKELLDARAQHRPRRERGARRSPAHRAGKESDVENPTGGSSNSRSDRRPTGPPVSPQA
jgi:hypothetical protein